MTVTNQKNKKKKIWRKAGIAVSAIFTLLLLLIITLPILLKGKIRELVKSEINKHIEANVDFEDVTLSLIKSFPNLNATVRQINIIGVGEFEGKKLMSIEDLILELDIFSVILASRQIDIRNFSLNSPDINIIINIDGKANYDVFRDSPEDESSGFQGVNLQRYSIKEGIISYTDHRDRSKISARNISHEGKGNFSENKFLLKTKTSIEAMSYESAGIPMAKDLRISWDVDLDIDMEEMMFRIAENELQINELMLISEGTAKANGDDLEIDFNINAPGNSFGEIFSLVPYAYTEDFREVEATGHFSFAGSVTGIYSQKNNQIPAFDFHLKASDSHIKYPDFELPIEKINADIRLFNSGDSFGNTIVNIDPLTFSLGGEAFLLRSLVSALDTDPQTTGEIKGTLNLGALSKAFPMPDVKRLNGKIFTDVEFNVNQSMTKNEIRGNAKIDKMDMLYSDLPAIKINSLNAEFRNDHILCREIEAMVGKSDFSGSVKISDPLNFISGKEAITLDISSRSTLFNASEWISIDDGNTGDAYTSDDLQLVDLINRKFVIKYNLNIVKLIFEDYDIRDMEAEGIMFSDILVLNNTDFLLSGSRVRVKGQLNDIVSWSLLDKVLSGDLEIRSPHFDMDRFMGTEESDVTSQGEEDLFSVPDKMNLMVNTSIGKLNYTGKEMYDLNGQIGIIDQEMYFNGFTAKSMGGNIGFSGIFSTKDKTKPEFDMMLSLNRVHYENLFNQVITVQSLAPIFQYLNGFFNAEFSFKGLLTEDLSPKLQSITAFGIFEAINGAIKTFSATKQISDKLGIKSIENMSIDNVKGNFEISDGEFKIKPFNVNYEDMVFSISGTNRLDKTIDYIVKASIPRTRFDKVPGGINLNKGIDFITGEARKKGLDIEAGENVLLDIVLSGLFSKPDLKFNFKGSEKGSIKSELEKQAESVVSETREQLESEVEKKKDEIADKTREVLDTTRKQVETRVQETIEDMKKKAQSELESRIDSTTKSKTEDLLKKHNPFKKK